MIRFTIRDLLWLMVVVGLGITLAIQHQQGSWARKKIRAELSRLTTIDVVQMPLRDMTAYLTHTHQIPVFLADEVDGDVPVTVQLKNVPLCDAFDGILSPRGLEYEVKNGWIVIKPGNR